MTPRARRLAWVVVLAGLPYALSGAVPGSEAPASYDGTDPLLQSAILTHSAQGLPLRPDRWDLPIFHPTPHALAFMDPLLGQAASVAWIPTLRAHPGRLYFAAFILSIGLAALAVIQLARAMGMRESQALIAAALYVLSPFAVAHWHHLNQLASPWMPWAFLGLWRLARGERWGAPLFLAAMLGQLSYGIYGMASTSVAIAPVALGCLLRAPGRARWQLALALVALGIILFLYSTPYRVAMKTIAGFDRDAVQAGPYGARIFDLWHGPRGHLLPWPAWIGGRGVIYPGLGVLALAVTGAWWGRRRCPKDSKGWILLALVGALLGVLLSAGRSAPLPGFSEEPSFPFAWLQDSFWPLRAIRAPYRFFQPMTLALALLAPVGALLLWRRWRLVGGALVVLAALDFAPTGVGTIRLEPDADERALIAALAADLQPWSYLPQPCFESLESAVDARAGQWAVLSGAPVVGGSSGFVPPRHAKLRQRCCGGLNEGCLRALEEMGVRRLVLPVGALPSEMQSSVRRFGGHALLELNSP